MADAELRRDFQRTIRLLRPASRENLSLPRALKAMPSSFSGRACEVAGKQLYSTHHDPQDIDDARIAIPKSACLSAAIFGGQASRSPSDVRCLQRIPADRRYRIRHNTLPSFLNSPIGHMLTTA